MASIAINGLGRVGRAALKVLEQAAGADVVGVNDLAPPDNLAYLLRYDTVYDRWHTTVTADDDALVVGGRKIPVLARRDPAELPWRDLGVDLVLKCTGAFRREEDLKRHLSAGAAMTRVVDGTLVKVMSWHDNEWGFTCQMIREAFTALGLPAPDLSQIRP